jgi:hypothetical protein
MSGDLIRAVGEVFGPVGLAILGTGGVAFGIAYILNRWPLPRRIEPPAMVCGADPEEIKQLRREVNDIAIQLANIQGMLGAKPKG